MKLRLFIGAYNASEGLLGTLGGLVHLKAVLQAMDMSLEVLLIDDASTDDTWVMTQYFATSHDWITTHRNEQNQGNARVVMRGYKWALTDVDADTLVACCDADGEHDPVEIGIRLRRRLFADPPSLVGTICYPDHLVAPMDRAGMRMLGELQALAAEAGEPFYVHSPGFQVHQAADIAPVINGLLPRYVEFYTKFRDGQLPPWGIHGVILHLLASTGVKIQPVYLACYGAPPNRTPDRLRRQMQAGLRHFEVITEFLALPGN